MKIKGSTDYLITILFSCPDLIVLGQMGKISNELAGIEGDPISLIVLSETHGLSHLFEVDLSL